MGIVILKSLELLGYPRWLDELVLFYPGRIMGNINRVQQFKDALLLHRDFRMKLGYFDWLNHTVMLRLTIPKVESNPTRMRFT